MGKVVLFLIILLIITTSSAFADLFERYVSNNDADIQSSMSYKFGINYPSLNNSGGTTKFLDASIGVDVSSKKGCGLFTDMTTQISALFNGEKLVQGLTGAATGIISAMPATLMCYASQTLCDGYKFIRNMANFSGQMKQLSCQQYEQIGSDIGDRLRKKEVQRCAMEKAQNGLDYAKALEACEGSVESLPISIPGTGFKQEGGYNLSEAIAKNFSDDPKLQESIKNLLGDVKFSASGISGKQIPELAEERKLSEYTQKFREAVEEIVENSIATGKMPSIGVLQTISTPGYPITPALLSRIKYMDGDSRRAFYNSYATVAGMTAMTIEIEDLIDKLEMQKAADPTNEAYVSVIEEKIKKLERKLNLLQRRLTIQKEFLTPMFAEIMNYQRPHVEPAPRKDEISVIIPKSIFKK